MTGAILGLVAVILPMTGVMLGMIITINKTLGEIAMKLENIEHHLIKED